MGKKQTEVDQINAMGHANGWAAQCLQKKAARLGVTMSQLWKSETLGKAIAFCVPARCVSINSVWADYVFLDGSKVAVRVSS